MGLDVCFDYNKAVKAGLILDKQRNGDEDSIANQLENVMGLMVDCDNEWLIRQERDYLCWLHQVEPVCQVPDQPDCYWRSLWKGPDGSAHVRANKWGDFYAPLTDFLKKNGIEWDEY